MAAADDAKVIGYFAYASPSEVVCDGDACIVAGSDTGLRAYVSELGLGSTINHTLKKTRFGVFAQCAHETGDGGKVRSTVPGQRNKGHLLAACALDGAAADNALRVGEQHDLEQQRGRVSRSSRFIVDVACIETGKVEFLVEQMVERVFEGSQETLGEMAHIFARSNEGPRGAETISAADRDAYDNLILLCPTHHAQVDKDSATWTVARLRSVKAAHEGWVSEQLGAGGIRVSAIDNSVFLAQREAAWIEASRGQVAMVLSLTPLRVSGETLDTLDKSIVDILEKACVPATDSRATQVNRYRTRPTEFGVANEDFPNTPHRDGYSVQIFRVGHCEYLCEFGTGVDHITRYAKERKDDLAGADKVVRYTDIAMVVEHGLIWLSAAWEAILPFNYMTLTVALINTNLTTLYSRQDGWRTVYGFVVQSPVLKFSDVLAKGFDRSTLLLESLRRTVNGYGLTLDSVHDGKKEYVRPERMR